MTDNLPAEKKWTSEQMALIQNTMAPNCNQNEFALMMYQAKTYRVDPLLRQIWAVKYQQGQPARIFIGRDGYLAIAHQSGQFDGMETRIDGEGDRMTATATVYRKDMTHPVVVSVKFSEYNTMQGNWVKMPETMLKKVAESQALRKAFNVSGNFSPEETSEEEPRQVIDVTPTDKEHPDEAVRQPDWIRKAREQEAKKKKQQDIIAS